MLRNQGRLVTQTTGKVIHIPRPEVWELNDEENTKEWAELSYEDGELCVTARQEFFDTATYPVRIDPTFGYTTQGASSIEFTHDNGTNAKGIRLSGVDGTLDSLTAYVSEAVSGSGESFELQIYQYGGTDTSTHTEVFCGTEAHSGGFAAVTSTAGGEALSSSNDYLLYPANGTGHNFGSGHWDIAYDSDAAATTVDEVTTASTSACGSDYTSSNGLADSDRQYSIYATYTASGGAARRIFLVD